MLPQLLGFQGGHQSVNTHDIYHSFEVVGKDMQTPLCFDIFQCSCKQLVRSCPLFNCTKGMLHSLMPKRHCIRHAFVGFSTRSACLSSSSLRIRLPADDVVQRDFIEQSLQVMTER